MSDKAVSYTFYAMVIATAVGAFFLFTSGPRTYLDFSQYGSFYGDAVQEPASSTPILFVGDVMLARHVEKHMREKGVEYPFLGMKDVFPAYAAVVGNFEASIPTTHVPTQAMTFTFSVDAPFAEALETSGFTHMTLANNHAYDFGVQGYDNTLAVLRAAGIQTGGRPADVRPEDVLIIESDGFRLGLIPVYAVSKAPDMEAVKAAIASVATSTDIQIATIHWGEEYRKINNTFQRNLAHELVDAGIDAVIGHHPHVVQNIEYYKEAPIFYSLGNFIFDQYWNEDVKTGLAVAIAKEGSSVHFSLLPVYSALSSPSLLQGEARDAFLADLAVRSDSALAEGIKGGVIDIVPSFLASRGQ